MTARSLPIVLLAMLLISAESPAQSARPAFEVASIKPDTNCGGDRRLGSMSPGRLDLPCATLRGLIRIAYGGFTGEIKNTRPLDVLGGPPWLDSDRYDISAEAEGTPSAAQMFGPMLQVLLEDRFRVKVHTEPRETPVYALIVAKGNPKLKPSQDGSCTPIDLMSLPGRDAAPGKPRPTFCGSTDFHGRPGLAITDSYGITMAEFAGLLSSRVDRPVIDKTGITGHYDIHLEFTRDINRTGPALLNGQPAPPPPPDAKSPDALGTSLFTALQQQLGLKLVAEKDPLDVIVVDHAEKPTGN